MTRIRNVGGKIIERTGGKEISYAKESIVFNAAKTISFTANDGIFFEEPKELPFRPIMKESVLEINSDLYMFDSQEFKIPYLDVSGILNYKSSKPFIANIRSIFGDDINHKAAKKLMIDLIDNKLVYPKIEISTVLTDSQGAYYTEGVITINEKLILESEQKPEKAWLLFRALMEETGHYIDDLLRNKYDNIGGDNPKDEGVLFTADFIRYNRLLFKDFEFATVQIKSRNGDIREFKPKVLVGNPKIESKAKDLLFVAKNDDDHGIITLESGKKINVEFFKIKGAGAIHENITKRAAKEVGVPYDSRLDEGCAWPDVPCEDENSIETCYVNTLFSQHKEGTMAFKSHYGENQYWHSMAPSGNHTNQEVIDLIVSQAKIWFKKGFLTKGFLLEGDNGLFHIGKILHMIQDSYSASHVYRNEDNQIIQFQGYDAQDADKHGDPDKDGEAKGVNDAFIASVWVLLFYKIEKGKNADINLALPKLENYLRKHVYILAPNRGSIKAGGSLEAYKKS